MSCFGIGEVLREDAFDHSICSRALGSGWHACRSWMRSKAKVLAYTPLIFAPYVVAVHKNHGINKNDKVLDTT